MAPGRRIPTRPNRATADGAYLRKVAPVRPPDATSGAAARRVAVVITALVALSWSTAAGGSTGANSATTEVVSRATAEAAPVGGSGGEMASDGKRVLFTTEARLVAEDANVLTDVYVRDRATGATRLVSKTTAGVAAGIMTYSIASISPDGKWASYITSNPDAAQDGALPTPDIDGSDARLIVVDLETQTSTLATTCIELLCTRVEPSGSIRSVISNDARFVAYNTGGTPKLWDRVARTSEDVAIRADGTRLDDQAWVKDVSGDGRFVTFTSYAQGIVPGTSFGDSLYIRDRRNATTVSVPDLGDEFGGFISEDGSSVVYSRYIGQISNVHVYRTATGRDELVSARPDGTRSPDISFTNRVSTTGRYVNFDSYDTKLVSGDSNNFPDVFVRDTLTATTVRISLTSTGKQVDNYTFGGDVSADGTMATFGTEASNVVAGDQPETFDVFLRGP